MSSNFRQRTVTLVMRAFLSYCNASTCNLVFVAHVVHVFVRIFLERLFALDGAEVYGHGVVVVARCGFGDVHVHFADRVNGHTSLPYSGFWRSMGSFPENRE